MLRNNSYWWEYLICIYIFMFCIFSISIPNNNCGHSCVLSEVTICLALTLPGSAKHIIWVIYLLRLNLHNKRDHSTLQYIFVVILVKTCKNIFTLALY